MSYITRNKTQMFKDERNKITVNKDLLAFVSDFDDIYFANDLNWKKIAVYFKHTTSNQKKVIVLMSDSDQGWFKATNMARTGVWSVDKIQIFDKDGGSTIIEREGIPDPDSFNISTVLKIAPFEEILTFMSSYSFKIDASKLSFYKPGYKLRIYDLILDQNHNDTVYTIVDIVGDLISLDRPVNEHQGKRLAIKFPTFDNSSAEQRSMFQYIGKNFGQPISPDPIVEVPGIMPSIVGTWRMEETVDNATIIEFKSDKTYLITSVGAPEFGGFPGTETGTYTWDNFSGLLSPIVAEDNNGEWGFSNPEGNYYFMVSHDSQQVSLFINDELAGVFYPYEFPIEEPMPSIVGNWTVPMENGYFVNVTFREDGTYTQTQNTEDEDPPYYYNGNEHGTYLWNNITGELTPTVTEDNNGENGFSHPEGTYYFRPKANGTEMELFIGEQFADLLVRLSPPANPNLVYQRDFNDIQIPLTSDGESVDSNPEFLIENGALALDKGLSAPKQIATFFTSGFQCQQLVSYTIRLHIQEYEGTSYGLYVYPDGSGGDFITSAQLSAAVGSYVDMNYAGQATAANFTLMHDGYGYNESTPDVTRLRISKIEIF